MTKTLSLYNIATEYQRVLEELNDALDNEDITQESFNDTLDSLSADVEGKSLNVAAYYKNIEKEIDAMKEYENNMKSRRYAAQNKLEKLREYLKSNMQRCAISKIKGPEFTISIRKGVESIEIENPALIPQEYVKDVNINYDKRLIKQAIKDGVDVPGVCLVKGKDSLMIK